jgi:single-stranded-DNA-specific exonuclease
MALRSIRTGPLALLLEHAGLGREITGTDIAFRIAPRLNAAGRMAEPLLALRALLEGGEPLLALEKHNTNRQQATEELYREILRDHRLDPSLVGSGEDVPLIAAASERYPHGIIGLLAGRLTEAFGKPSIVCAIDGDLCTASLRSPPGYHVTEGLERSRELLLRFGGHAQAAGCTCTRDAFPLLTRRLAEDIRRRVDTRELLPLLRIDAAMDAREISLSFCQALASFEPFGMGNPEPRFLLRAIRVERARRVGGEGHHLQGRIAGLKAIGFRLGHLFERAGQPLDAVCRLGIDTWQGSRAPQIFLDDLRVAVPSSAHTEEARMLGC